MPAVFGILLRTRSAYLIRKLSNRDLRPNFLGREPSFGEDGLSYNIMASEGGSRPYWPNYAGVNFSNGNLHFGFGSTSCVTCGGGGAQSYPSPMASRLAGPVLIFNSLGTPETDLGPHWKLPDVYGDNNEMTDAGPEEFTFDHFGNTASIVNTESYSYDFEGHMRQREDLSIEAIDNHEYDGNGRRMRSKFANANDWTNFIHDELTENLICEYTLISGTYSIKALNTYGLGLISTNRESTIRYFHFDGLGSTYHLTDTSQNITDSYTYDAFGVPLSASGSSVNPYRYVGQWGYYDDSAMGSSSGMLLLGVRYYWPRYGRFTLIDTLYWGESYFYCNNASTMQIDPSGFRGLIDIVVGPTLGYRRSVGPFYGQFCGPQTFAGTSPGIDELDRCCEAHDNCWRRHGCNAFNQGFYQDCAVCTLMLCACALRAKCTLFATLMRNCVTAKAIVVGYACSAVSLRQRLLLSIFGVPNCHGGEY